MISDKALLQGFDLVIDSPENISLLRRYIVSLAVRGKLLETNDYYHSAAETLKHIETLNPSITKQGKPKKLKLLPISDDEIPTTCIGYCRFERLGKIATLEKGATGIQGAIPGEYPLVVTAAARSTCDHYDFDGKAAIIPMVSSTGHGNASLNRLHYQEGKFALGTILCAVFPIDEELISARFLYEYLTAYKDELLVSKMNGTANVTLTVGKIAEVPIPILSPVVQRRLKRLMSLCDQLEIARNEREAWRDGLVAASLDRIGAAKALPVDARFFLDQLSQLSARPEHIKQLRQTIVNLAVSGRLVAPDYSDEPAEHQLKGIQNSRTRRRKLADLDPLLPLPGLPENWVWTVVDQIAADADNAITDGPFGANLKTEHYILGPGYRVIRLQNIGHCSFRGQHKSYIDASRFNLLSKHHVFAGDLVVAGLVDPSVRCCELPADIGPALVKADCYRFQVHPKVSSKFAMHYLNSDICQQFASIHHHGMTLTRIGLGNFRQIPFPLPPLLEQQRIVAKVDELMALCDQLEAQLLITGTDSRRLLEAVLRDALALN